MPHVVYAHKVNRVTLSGTMFSAAEEWSTGFWMGEEGADASVPTQAMANAILPLWRTFFEAAQTKVHNQYLTTQVKVAHINTNGTTDSANVVYAYPATELNGNDASSPYPPQCSMVVTLLSDRPRGLASKGRMYLPGYVGAITGNGKVSSLQTGELATQFETFFNGIRAHADIPNTPILAAKGTGLFPELTAQNDYIEKIKIGDVIDTQRRRRNGLAETYVLKTLV